MLDEMRVNDEQLNAGDIRQLANADEIAHFFAKLRYVVDQRTYIPDYAVLGIGSEDMRQHIHKIELIGKDPEDGDISIYLFEVRSVTAKLRNDIARRFRERPEKGLLVLTQDYDELELSCWNVSSPKARAGALRSNRRSVLSRSR
jgi:hypothetical protein